MLVEVVDVYLSIYSAAILILKSLSMVRLQFGSITIPKFCEVS